MSRPGADKEPWIHAFNMKHLQDTMIDTVEKNTKPVIQNWKYFQWFYKL